MIEKTPYLGGQGVHARTDALVDALLQRLFWGYAGFALTCLVFGMTLGGPYPVVIPGSLLFLVPWLVTAVRLQIHINRLNRETRSRGRGWAKS